MGRGGIRAGAGRPPQEQSRARDRAKKKGQAPVIDDGEWLVLPREGRTANPPAWPLSAWTKRESELWRRQWKRPQSLGWERAGLDETVAMYVRTLAEAEEPGSAIGLKNLVRQQQDALGLTAPGMRMLRWKIGQGPRVAAADPVETPTEPQPARGALVPPKQRLRLVSDGGG